MIATTKISPNDFNPNAMSEAEFNEYRAEAEHLGRLPKPLVVRRNGDGGYAIIDGEHGWKVAKEKGWAEVPCEILDVDEFEAMRQAYKRNRHGTDNRVRLGRMFKNMMGLRKLKQRAFAREIGVSEGTVRNALLYAHAAKMRKHYAPEGADDKIAGLTVEQVRYYHDLPKGERDRWLDAGAKIPKSKPPAGPRKRPANPNPGRTPDGEADTAPCEETRPTSNSEDAPQTNSEGEPSTESQPTSVAAESRPEPADQAGAAPAERADPEALPPPKVTVDHDPLDRLMAAWDSALESTRRKFLTRLLEDRDTVALTKELAKNRPTGWRSSEGNCCLGKVKEV
jgi:hypothetical protein